ncbi:DUF3575 domain-containing protein [Botryobacter ruber]|uniref:DUF3575 domain-containing protein n=1 Tax=Botryobacter ruber TaxID=2171629 RepID=UPI000E0B801A|nr:DUF3575 domain-containing protein [Botryobacter ruber]
MKALVISFFCLMPFFLYGQEISEPFGSKWIVKTNVLNLVAKRPTISIEKNFTKSFSLEGSFVHGHFNYIPFVGYYEYNGYLLKAKKYHMELDYGILIPYSGIYAGSLHRTIETAGEVWGGPVSVIGWRARKFQGHSIRGGGSFGLTYFTKSQINFDGQISLGYGRYLNLDLSDPNTYSKDHPDVQFGASIGYCF